MGKRAIYSHVGTYCLLCPAIYGGVPKQVKEDLDRSNLPSRNMSFAQELFKYLWFVRDFYTLYTDTLIVRTSGTSSIALLGLYLWNGIKCPKMAVPKWLPLHSAGTAAATGVSSGGKGHLTLSR